MDSFLDILNDTSTSHNATTSATFTALATVASVVATIGDNASDLRRNFTAEEVMREHFYYGILIDRIITPFWYVIGLVGNTISAIVWLKPRMRKNSSSAIYLSALSINDNLFLLLHLPQELHYAWYLGVLDVPVFCQMFGILCITFQYLSPILVLSFTFDRFIAICYPFKKYRFCTISTAVKMILMNVLVSLAFSSVQGYLWNYNNMTKLCEVREEVLDESHGSSFWLKWTTISESIFFFFIPSLNTFLNILVIHEIWKISGRSSDPVTMVGSKPSFSNQVLQGSQSQQQPSLSRLSMALNSANCRRKTNQHSNSASSNQNGNTYRQHQHLLVRPLANRGSGSGSRSHGNGSGGYTSSCNSSNACGAQQSGSAAATNAMLLSVSFYVIFTTLPPAIIYSLESKFPYGNLKDTNHELISHDPEWQRFFKYMFVRGVIYELSLSHYACNVFLFAFTGRKFREALSSTFRCRLWRNDLDDASSFHGAVGDAGGGIQGGAGVGDISGWFLGPQEHSSSQQQQQQQLNQQSSLLSPLRCETSENNTIQSTSHSGV